MNFPGAGGVGGEGGKDVLEGVAFVGEGGRDGQVETSQHSPQAELLTKDDAVPHPFLAWPFKQTNEADDDGHTGAAPSQTEEGQVASHFCVAQDRTSQQEVQPRAFEALW